MTDLNETDSNTNNDIDTDTKDGIANSISSDIDSSTANEDNTKEIDTSDVAISKVSDNEQEDEITVSGDDTTPDVGVNDVTEDIETRTDVDVKPDAETDTVTATETDTVIVTETEVAEVKDEKSSKSKDNTNGKNNHNHNHEPSSDVIYEGEIMVPMDVDVLIAGLIAKHNHYIDKYQSEFNTLDPVIGEIMPKLEAAKKSRDEINERIVVLKEKRRQLYHQAKGMRTEMYKLMDIDNDLKSVPIESKKIRDDIEELDWTLQTTQMSTSKERDIVKTIRILDAKLHTMDSDVDREAEVSAKISELKEILTATMGEANNTHEEIMRIADESQKFHEEYITYNEVARGSGSRHKWLSARITSHREALLHWTERAPGGVAND